MNTHELAEALVVLSRVLRATPPVPLDEFKSLPKAKSTASVAVNLATLAELSRVDKQQWSAIVTEYALPIEIRPRDASRDILGKMLKYLEANADARERLRRPAEGGKTSPVLLHALSSLLDI